MTDGGSGADACREAVPSRPADAMHPIDYRPEIDGLRAIAVVAVVLFHLGSPWLGGGYLGVDVFFVLSGFLITSIIQRKEEAGTFSLVHFWTRRIRRILPALLVMLLVTSLVSAAVCFKPLTIHYGEQGAAAAISCANILFWQQVPDYWAQSAQRTPFLHTWSLSVEEQFYLVHPLLVLGVLRSGRRYLPAVLAVVAAGSFSLTLPFSGWSPSAAFYLLPARGWELALGALLAALRADRVPARFARWASAGAMLGLVLVVGSCIAFDEQRRFAGSLAVPTIGTALVLACSNGRRDPVTRFLSLSPLAALGRMSYAIYLWHWPVIVLGESLGLSGDGPGAWIAMLTLIVLLAVASHRLVEMPLRYTLGDASALGVIAILLAASLAASAHLHYRTKTYDTAGFNKSRFQSRRYDAYSLRSENAPRRQAGDDASVSSPGEKPFATGGVVRRYGDSDPRIMVLGDSHVLMWCEVVDTICRDLGEGVCFYAVAGEQPFLTVPVDLTKRKNFRMTRAELLAYDQGRLDALERWKPKVVVLGSRWEHHYRRIERFDDLIEACGRAGSTVLLIEQPPPPYDVNGDAVQYLSYLGMRPKEGVLQALPGARQHDYRKGRESLKKLVERYPFCRIVSVADRFYSPEQDVWVLDGKDVLFWDDDHVSQAGAERASDLIRAAIREAL